MNQNICEIIDVYRNLEHNYKNEILIVLVANVEGKTNDYDDYESTSVLSEYYTLDEFENISITYKKLGYEVICYFSEKDFMNAIINNKINTDKKLLVINSAQSGTYVGRKSLIPSFCDHYKIMHSGSNAYVVSLCRNKFHTSKIIDSYVKYNLNTYLFDIHQNWLNNSKPQIGECIILKLNSESASIGLTKDNIIHYNGEESDNYIANLAQKYKQPIVVQPFVSGYEVELPIILSSENTFLLPIGISIKENYFIGDAILDYTSRFEHSYDFYNFCEYNEKLANQLQQNSIQIADILGLEGFCRIDYRINCNNEYYITDIATNPHITKDSSFAYAFSKLEYSYDDMFSCLIGCTLSHYYKSLQ